MKAKIFEASSDLEGYNQTFNKHLRTLMEIGFVRSVKQLMFYCRCTATNMNIGVWTRL